MTTPATTSPVATTTASSKPVLVVVGLKREEDIAQGPNMVVVMAASDPKLLRARLAALKASDYRAVVSFGVSGGLLPALKVGDLLLAREVLSPTAAATTWSADNGITAGIAAKLAAAGMPAHVCRFVGADDLAANNGPGPKAALLAATGADSVDMESHVAAEFAAAGGVPFVAIRSPSDDSTATLPPAALVPLNQDGTTNYVGVALSVITDPWQIPLLFQLYQGSEAAFATLEAVRKIIDLGGL